MISTSSSVILLSLSVVINLCGALHPSNEYLSNTSKEELILHEIGKSV